MIFFNRKQENDFLDQRVQTNRNFLNETTNIHARQNQKEVESEEGQLITSKNRSKNDSDGADDTSLNEKLGMIFFSQNFKRIQKLFEKHSFFGAKSDEFFM